MRRTPLLPLALFLAAAALFPASPTLTAAGPNKLPVPEPDKLEKARKFIHHKFAEDYVRAAKALADRRPLAVALQAEARNAKDSDAVYYTILHEAAEVAAQAGDAALAFEAIAEISQTFAVDPVALKAAVLVKACQTVSEPEVFLRLTTAALAVMDTAMAADDFATAASLRDAATTTIAKTQSKELHARLQRSTKILDGLQAEFDKVKPHLATLKANPKDAAANLAVGKYLCLGKGQWDKGLPLLLLGNDSSLKDLAQRDLANPAKPAEQLALGDAYWDLSENAKDPAQLALQKRAAHWYGQAYPELAGINKTKIEKRLQSAGLELPAAKVAVGLLKTFQGHTRQVQSADISRDNKFIISGGDDDDLRFWDVATGKEIKTFKGHTMQVWSVCFSPDGKYILSTGEDQSVRLWDVAAAKELKVFNGHTVIVNRVIFSPDGKRAVSVSDDHTVRLWDIDTGKEVMQFTGHQKPVWGASFSKDGSKLVTSGEDNVAIVWDAKTGKELQRYSGHTDIVFTVAVSPDGKHVVSAGRDGVLHLWELETGKEVRKFEGHTGTVYSVAFAPDGKRILSAGEDKAVRLWDVNTAKQTHTFEGHTDEVGSVAFSADGRYAVSAGIDMTVRLWGLPK
jgi:Tol biopolymer transport system component